MQSSFAVDPYSPAVAALAKQVYRGFQWSKNYFGLAHKTLSTRLLSLAMPPIDSKSKPLPPELLAWIQQQFDQLIETDWQDAERGVYPTSLLFDNPWDDFFRFYPVIWFDLPEMWQRANQKRYHEFADGIQTSDYPSYYLQNFHHQTDGYLSDTSANLYDLQVEILFGGTADPMRRRILGPLKQELKATALAPHQLKILDLACGTGRTLKQLRATFSQAALCGTDLSPTYLRKANQSLSQNPGELPQLLQANAEALPYLDNYFHAVSSVFLFHELPAEARQNVINQAFRVLQPGGVFVICDSVQAIDSPQLAPMMENFTAIFHEPYYRHYVTDDLNLRLTEAGFAKLETQTHFMSKYWVARKPGSI
ncbi:MAG: class I SAM-dependent methyltransferase [Aphanocapsa sp. GSE-SYN-MK-11-07L]|jgi:ubiquinone/menaquinone biosynthesis C-methylase UbiE|nr:class I SAM-dependent methyltransferase [Aphanocapsa sp. GSE-SYN-MK-11-07L]